YAANVAPQVTIRLQGSSDNFSSDVNTLGTIGPFTDLNDESAARSMMSGLNTSAAYQYHRAQIVRGDGPSTVYCAELRLYEHTPNPLEGVQLIGNGSGIAWAQQDVTTTDTGQEHILAFRVI